MKIDVEQLILWASKDSSLCYIPLHCVNICHCDWFNKEADWPIVRQDKVRQENQTKRMLGRRSRRGPQETP